MKLLLALTILAGLMAFSSQGNCGCTPASDEETTRWGGNGEPIAKEDKVHRYLSGVVSFGDGEPVSDALVEVYTNPEYLLLDYPEREKQRKEQERIAACVTGKSGKFCFGFIQAGKYELRVSKDEGINVTHIYVDVDPYDKESTDEEISAILTPGL